MASYPATPLLGAKRGLGKCSWCRQTSLPLKPVALERYRLSSADTIPSTSGVAEIPVTQTSYPPDSPFIPPPPMSESLEWVSSFVGDAPPGEVRNYVHGRH